MAILFYIPGPLREFTAGLSRVEIESPAATVGEALASLSQRHPGIRARIFTEQGSLREHLSVFVGDECIRFTGGLATSIGENAEIFIIPAVSGGSEGSESLTEIHKAGCIDLEDVGYGMRKEPQTATSTSPFSIFTS